MLRLKLHSFLRTHGITESALANAIADIVTDSREPVSERYLRYLKNNTEPLTPKNSARRPSLLMLGFIIQGLRHLTGETVDVADILEYAADPNETELLLPRSFSAKGQPDSPDPANDEDDLVGALVPLKRESGSFGLLDRIRDLTIRQLKTNGLNDLVVLFAAAVGDESGSRASPKRRRWSTRRWGFVALALLLTAAVAVFAYDRLIAQPRLLAARGGIFAFRDRVKATSDLAIPTLIGPEGEIEQLEPVLRVSDVPGALAYEFYVEDLVSGDGVYTGPLPHSAFPIPAGTLCPNTPYEWRVRVLGGDGWTSFSSGLEFTVSPETLDDAQQALVRLAQIEERPDQPVMVSPLGSASSTALTLEVEPAEDVMGYGFYIRDLQTDQVIYNNNFALTHEVQVPDDLLEEGGIYQWNVRARNCHYWSEFTPAQVFNVDVQGGE